MKTSFEGWRDGLLGVVFFSGSLPATRVALAAPGFSPMFLTAARATIAAGLGSLLLATLRSARPARGDLPSLLIVALGVVLGFPLLTALALQDMTAAHSILFVGLLPLSTALFAVLCGGERPRPPFWAFSIAGSSVVVAFALAHDASVSLRGDLLMVAAVVVCGLGYAEGGKLSRRLGGWQVICWSLLIASPPMVALGIMTAPSSWRDISTSAWAGLLYVSVFSMLVGFVFWYRGLARGGIARVGQLQLLQPFLGFALAGLWLHEPVESTMIATGGIVALCVGLARQSA